MFISKFFQMSLYQHQGQSKKEGKIKSRFGMKSENWFRAAFVTAVNSKHYF